MNYRDVEMLNGAIGNLGSTLARNRLLEEQRQERDQQSFERQQERADALNLGNERIDATNRATDARKAMATDAVTQKKKETVNKVWNDTVNLHGKWVKEGVMKPDVAKKGLLNAYSQMPDEAKAMLADNPLATGLQSEDFSFQEPKSPTESSTAEIKNHEYAKILRAQAKNPGIAPADAAKLNAMADQFESTIGHQQRPDAMKLARARFVAKLAMVPESDMDAKAKRRALAVFDAQTADDSAPEAAPVAPAAPAVDITKEKQLAVEAIGKGAKPEVVAEKFKQRTGQDLKF